MPDVRCVDEWWLTDGPVDHIYRSCPAVLRSRVARRGVGPLFPEGGDVCGWCLRVWKARNP